MTLQPNTAILARRLLAQVQVELSRARRQGTDPRELAQLGNAIDAVLREKNPR